MSSTSLIVHVFAPAVASAVDIVTQSLLFARVIYTHRSSDDISPVVKKYVLCMQPMILDISGMA